MDALGLIQERVRWCETEGVSILCCPEAILGGLADFSEDPTQFAITANSIANVLAPLASDTVTTIVGFTELTNERLYNSAAVFQKGRVMGIYRKLHPAIRQSVYAAGSTTPVFRVAGLTFGIVICYDSTFPEPATAMVAQGASVLFVPTNNGFPVNRACAELVREARASDIARAAENSVWVIRADVAGSNGELISLGSSGIVDPMGRVVQEATLQSTDLLIADIPDDRPIKSWQSENTRLHYKSPRRGVQRRRSS
jgi:5-aminopentanamidase